MDRESQLIQRLRQLFPPPTHGIGIGDDCAVIPIDDQQAWLFSTDALVEDTHFCHAFTTPEQLAVKTLMVNISDIAAMGGTPTAILLNLALPEALSGDWAERFLRQLARLLPPFKMHLIGGDTVSSPQKTFINVTIIGSVAPSRIKYRHTAQAGDVIALTKPLGASFAGLQLLLKKWSGDTHHPCISQHLLPQAQLAEGQWLGRQSAVHAMMDLSDGLSLDLPKLCAASQLGALIALEEIPIDHHAATLALTNHVRPIDIAYSGGEDYGLLVCIAADAFAAIATAYHAQFNHALTPIGTMRQPGAIDWCWHGDVFHSRLAHFSHF